MRRARAVGSMPEPPMGVVQPNSCRPDVTDIGSTPVPGRRGSWMVANPSHITNDRTSGCWNRSNTTSWAVMAESRGVLLGLRGVELELGRRQVAHPPVHRLELVPLAEERQVGVGVARREPADLVGRAGAVPPHGDARPVLERHHQRGVGEDVPQAVPPELQLVVAHERVRLDQDMGARTGVVPEARQRQLLGDGVAAEQLARLEHDHAEPRPGEICRRDQAVVPGPRDHDVGLIPHAAHAAHASTRPCLPSSCKRLQP